VIVSSRSSTRVPERPRARTDDAGSGIVLAAARRERESFPA